MSTPKPKSSAYLAPADTFETADSVYVKMDLPGISKNDVTVTVTDGNLHISGCRKVETTNPDMHFLHSERKFGHFSRLFRLPLHVDFTKISATCDHGVLTVAVPKLPSDGEIRGPRQVHVVEQEEEGNGALNHDFQAVSVKVFPLPSSGKLVVINSDCSIADAVKTLAEYHILAAPIRDVSKADNAPWSEKYLGFLDMTTVVTYMLEKLPKMQAPTTFEKQIANVEEFKTTTVGDVCKFVRIGQFVPVDLDRGNLLDCMLLCGQHGLRRVPVVKSPGGDLINIITQSALVQTLLANLERFSIVAKVNLIHLGLAAPQRVYTVTEKDPLIKAFKLIRDYDISGVPVVDDKTGQIRGNISARDVRLIATSTKLYELLDMPIEGFLDVVNEGQFNSAITCVPEDTLEVVIKRMVQTRIHRIYVVDSQQHIIRVVSLRNILRKFVKEPPGYFGHFFD